MLLVLIDHGHYIAKGGDINSMIAEIYGKTSGCSKGYGGSMHLIDKSVNFMGSTAIVGNSIPVGVGLGLSIKLKKVKYRLYFLEKQHLNKVFFMSH